MDLEGNNNSISDNNYLLTKNVINDSQFEN